MAAKASHYGRRLIIFLVAVCALYGLVALTADWKPKLGLDLQGGTRITLQAQTEEGGNPPSDQLDEARSIIDQRVNGTGVAESEVTRQGNRFVVVEIPGKTNQSLIDTVKRQAQMRFRLVACSTADGKCGATTSTTPTTPTVPGTQPSSGATSQPSGGKKSGKSSGKNRAPLAWADKTKNKKKQQQSQ